MAQLSSKIERFEMTSLSSKFVIQSSKMNRRGPKISPQAGGLTVGRSWVARGSVGRSRVADFSSRSGNSRVAVWVSQQHVHAPHNAGAAGLNLKSAP